MKELKKYANRKIYDPSQRCYVNIHDICEMIQNHEQIKVVESKSGNDITRSILLQALTELDAEDNNSALTNYVLENMVRMYHDPLGNAMALYLDQSLRNFHQYEQGFKNQLLDSIVGNQPDRLKELTEQMMTMWSISTPANKK